MTAPTLETKRLILRKWKESDLEIFAKINSDLKVMEFFPKILSKEKSDLLAEKIIKELDEKKYGLWAVEVKNKAPFIGFIGLHLPSFKAKFIPCIEIAWRLAREHWNQGFAYEGAKAVLEYAFNSLKLNEVVSFTSEKNIKSINLMKKLNMKNIAENNFEHPNLPKSHPLRFHVFYKITIEQFKKI